MAGVFGVGGWAFSVFLPLPHPWQLTSTLYLMWVLCRRKLSPLFSVIAKHCLVLARHSRTVFLASPARAGDLASVLPQKPWDAKDFCLALGSMKVVFPNPSLDADGFFCKHIPAGLCLRKSVAAPS